MDVGVGEGVGVGVSDGRVVSSVTADADDISSAEGPLSSFPLHDAVMNIAAESDAIRITAERSVFLLIIPACLLIILESTDVYTFPVALESVNGHLLIEP